MRQIIKRWEAGGTLTAAERRQVRKSAGLPKSILGPSRRVTWDESHPEKVIFATSPAIERAWQALDDGSRMRYTDKSHFAFCEHERECQEFLKQATK